jgi:hypothetical protein
MLPASEVSGIARRWLKAHGDDAVVLARDMMAESTISGADKRERRAGRGDEAVDAIEVECVLLP